VRDSDPWSPNVVFDSSLMDNPLSVGLQHASFKVMGHRNCESSCIQNLPLCYSQTKFLRKSSRGASSVTSRLRISQFLQTRKWLCPTCLTITCHLPLIVLKILNLLKANKKKESEKRRGGRRNSDSAVTSSTFIIGGCLTISRISFPRERVYRAITKQRKLFLATVAQQRYYMPQCIC
jgi:hypothetical protein